VKFLIFAVILKTFQRAFVETANSDSEAVVRDKEHFSDNDLSLSPLRSARIVERCSLFDAVQCPSVCVSSYPSVWQHMQCNRWRKLYRSV